MAKLETTVRSRELGAGLRAVLTDAGLTGQQVAHRMEWSTSEVSRLLNGKRAIKEADLATFLAICDVRGDRRQRLLDLCREANKRGWYQQHGSRLPKQLRTYIDHEDKAIAIIDFQAMTLPGSLQTGAYARAVMERIASIPDDEVDERVAAQLGRQSIFSRRDTAAYTFFLHENVLRLPVGGAQVMREQLHHLIRMLVRPYITVRVLPTAIGAHAGLGGSFTLMEFASINPVVYLESETSTLFLEEPEEIDAYRTVIAALASTSLDAAQSSSLIRELAASCGMGEDRND